jgi:hypothetical protein
LTLNPLPLKRSIFVAFRTVPARMVPARMVPVRMKKWLARADYITGAAISRRACSRDVVPVRARA